MRIFFQRSDDGRLWSWRAELPGHRRVQGSTMAVRSGHTDLPYDLAHLVAEPNQVEWTVNALVQAWSDGRPTTVGPELEAVLARWRALRPGEELAADWPTRRLPRPSPCSS